MKLYKIILILTLLSISTMALSQNKVYFWGIPLGISQDDFAEKLIQKGCSYDTEEKCFRGTYLNDKVCIYLYSTAKSNKVYNVGVYYTQYWSTVDTASDYIKRMAKISDEYMEILGGYIRKEAFLMAYFMKRGERMVSFSEQIRKFNQRKAKLIHDFGTPTDERKKYGENNFIYCYKWRNEKTNRIVFLALQKEFIDRQSDIEYTAIRLDIIDNQYMNLDKYEKDQLSY